MWMNEYQNSVCENCVSKEYRQACSRNFEVQLLSFVRFKPAGSSLYFITRLSR